MSKKFILATMVFAIANTCYAAGLSTTFSEVTLEGLETGKDYSTSHVADLPLAVINTGDEATDLKMEILMPEVSELKEGYEPIPDISWIRLEQLEFKGVKPKEAATTDVKISIPGDQQYKGKRYQVFIWTHSTGTAIAVGLKSKLLFTIKE